MKRQRIPSLLKVLAIIAVIGMMLIILAGAVVTKTGSGDGCGPNWPLCYDQLIPSEPTLETMIEYTHRLITGVVGILVLAFSIWMAFYYRYVKEVIWVALASIFFLIFQSGLGALAVVYGQSKAVMALHFGFSLLSYAAVYVLAVYAFLLDKKTQVLTLPLSKSTAKLRWSTGFLFVWTYIVVYMGALVRHTDSGMGCHDWPLCNGQFIPDLTNTYIAVQFAHRLAALIFFIGFIFYMYYILKHFRQDRMLIIYALLMFSLATFQVITGGIVVLTNMAVNPSLIHALIITILFGFLSYVLLYVIRRPQGYVPDYGEQSRKKTREQ